MPANIKPKLVDALELHGSVDKDQLIGMTPMSIERSLVDNYAANRLTNPKRGITQGICMVTIDH